jgi:outer membrane lipoprotein-sorting protein
MIRAFDRNDREMVTIGLMIASSAIQQNNPGAIVERSLRMLDRATSVVGGFTQKTERRVGLSHGEFHLARDARLAVFGKLNSEICDGTFRTTIDKVKGTYTVKDVRVFDLPYIPGFEGFTSVNGKSLVEKFNFESQRDRQGGQPRDIKMTMMDGRSVVGYTVGGSNVFLDPISALPVGADFVNEAKQRVSMRFQNVKTDVRVDDNTFNFKGNEDMMVKSVVEQGNLRVGQRMPVSNIESMAMLDKAMAGKRNTVILFFDDRNAPCGEMLKKMFEISKHTPKDVAVIAVARKGNWRSMFTGSLNFRVIEDAELSKDSVTALFGVTKYPTLYVIDHQSEATYVQIGRNDAELNPVLRGLGFSIP